MHMVTHARTPTHTHTPICADPPADKSTMASVASADGKTSEMFPDLLQGGEGPHGVQEEQGQANPGASPPGCCKLATCCVVFL